MVEPTADEIAKWKNKLEDKTCTKHLRDFQDLVYEVCEEYRLMMGMLFIRVVLPRHELKSLESVVDKIRRNRKRDPNYGFDKIEDLIGVKILCPYASSAKKVGRWLYTQTEYWTTSPANLARACVSRDTGYTGYHFIATPNLGKHPDWLGLECEIQVKTMCQEAWDAQTHEITYRREESIDPDLLAHMQQLSKVLATVDNQGEIIKTQIQRLELEERERKDAAAIVYLWQSTKFLKDLRAQYGLNLSSNDPRRLKSKDLMALNEVIGKYHKELGVTKELCYLGALLAICQKHPKQEELALMLARQLVENNPDDPRAEDTKGSICWALNRLNEAISCGEEALRKAKTKKIPGTDLDRFKDDLCYWVAEAAMAGRRIRNSLANQVLRFGEELERTHQDNPGYLDTVGFVRIALGKTTEEVEQGIELIRKARRTATRSKDQYVKRAAKAFCRRHERLGFLRLAMLVR